MTKKLLSLVLILALALSLVACGKTTTSNETSSSEVASSNAGKLDDANLEELMAQIYAGIEQQINSLANQVITEENAKYFAGLLSLEDVEEALVSEPMIGSIAHSVCLIKVKEGADIEAVKEEIKTNIDPRKWICVGVEPEQVIVENNGRMILLVLDAENGENILNSFNELAK